ncbi:MAG: YfhO family protein [Candidatus Eisenbacteria bacterium]|uniref:YfhO family protein n=1 Tax=Eiseniibacteriota bacterium TaxID=2212470 RepID=A0A538T861_UNCEI|nr:MAG: YfhO family protein [Candidatus Eisenbacteria bacterium]
MTRPSRGAKIGARQAGPREPKDAADLSRWAWALVALLVLVFFYPIAFGKVFLTPDSVAPAGFARIALDALQKRHVYALWNPYHFLGMPSFGSLTFVPYVYPLDLVFGFLNKTLHFPDLTWLLAHYLLLAVSMLALLRALGASAEGAALGALTFALTPNLVAVGVFGHGSQIMTAAYLPLLILLLDRFVRRGSPPALAGFALAAALQLLRGHVQIVFYTWLALGGYAVFLAVQGVREGRRGEAARALGGLVGGLALGFGMSAFLYLPTHEYAKLSVRGGGEGGGAGLEYATSWSFHPREILTFVIPSMFGFGGRTYWGSMPFTDYPNYMGIVPLALAIYGAMRWRGKVRWYLVTMAGIALAMSFGKHLKPLYALLYDHLPFFNKFRVPVMVLVLVQFATGALAAFGLTRALERGAPTKGREAADPGASWMRAAVLSAAGGVAVVALLHALSGPLEIAAIHSRPSFSAEAARQALDLASLDAIKSGVLLGLGFFVIALARRGRIGRLAAGVLILTVTAVDLWVIDRKIIDPEVGSPQEYAEYFKETPEVTFLKSDRSLFRVYPLQWNDSRLAAYGIASVLGYHPAKPKLYQALADTAQILSSLDMLRFLNVKYVLTDGYIPQGAPGLALRHDGDVKVYELEGALPRAHVVHRLKPVRNDSVTLAIIRTGNFNPAGEALWTGPDPLPPMEEPGVPDSVGVIRYDFNEAEFLVSTSAPGLFVLSDQYDPDWRATLDGVPETIHRVDYLMRGVLVGPGVHRIRFRYEPSALQAGVRISIVSLALTVGLAGAGLIRRRSARRSNPKNGEPAGEPAA